MRRKDKEITDRAVMEDILNKADTLRIAMVDEGEPYLVALNHVYVDGALYAHSAKEGRKIDILRKNGKVAFQTEIDAAIILHKESAGCTTRYMSVLARAGRYCWMKKRKRSGR